MDIGKVFDIRDTILHGDGFIGVNKVLAKQIGLVDALVYSELVNLSLYWNEQKQLNKFGEFYWTVSQAEDILGLHKRQQVTIFKHLEELGLITVNNRVPLVGKDRQRAVRHIRILEDSALIQDFIKNIQLSKVQAETPLE